MPFRLMLRRRRRYNVLSKNYFVTRIRLLDNSVIECTLSDEPTREDVTECRSDLHRVRPPQQPQGLHRVRPPQSQTYLHRVRPPQSQTSTESTYLTESDLHRVRPPQSQTYSTESDLPPQSQTSTESDLPPQSKAQAPAQRWVEVEKPLKKQLDKFGNEPLLFFGVMFYVPNVSHLQQEATSIHPSVLWLAVLMLTACRTLATADFGDFTLRSPDFLREYVLFPVNWPNGDEVLEEWTQKVAEEHKSHCLMQLADAELLYIREVEKLDGFGQESFAAKDNYTNDIFMGVSFIGVFVKHRNGRSIMLHRWKDIGTIGHNKTAITTQVLQTEQDLCRARPLACANQEAAHMDPPSVSESAAVLQLPDHALSPLICGEGGHEEATLGALLWAGDGSSQRP
ncbi:hypothetical protein NHX12_026512 [Muraenolepis orangiensis]|uniref:Band 4.1 domain-containing protein n=1 Tax=Muraenolepis orangiensis TaxID=630683 RepID=A0A9Q0EFA1_9TELE|nr:hypothetical protein NHX12_026512 [Muraenolepis orangiensis]